jgi:hypothetical protein
MRTAALSIAVLLGVAVLGGAAQAQIPGASAAVTIEIGSTVLVGGKRKRDFHRGWAPHRHKGLARHYRRHHHVGRHYGHHHRPAFFAKRFHKGPVVIVRPGWGRSFGYRHLPARPLIRNGSFARSPYRW